MPPTEKITQLLSRGEGRLAALSRRCTYLQQLENQVLRRLPALLKEHCRVANYHSGQLILITTSPAWATRLRYHIPTLRDQLTAVAELQQLQEIRIRISPGAAPKPPAQAPPRRLKAQTTALISTLAATLDDPVLRCALQKLVRHHDRER